MEGTAKRFTTPALATGAVIDSGNAIQGKNDRSPAELGGEIQRQDSR